MKVVVIGCGPAGLAAAHAAVGLGAEVEVRAPKQMTEQRGPLLLQRPIPGINTDHPDGTIHQVVIGGSILDYRYKLYGDVNIGINGDILRPYYHAWRHCATYHSLWGRYEHLIVDDYVTRRELDSAFTHADLIVSTANAQSMCLQQSTHNFEFATVEVTAGASYPKQPDNTIIFNAGNKYDWVRSSRVFGVSSTEWIPGTVRDRSVVRIIKKPLFNDCSCHPRVLRTGRFGAWKNETWVDTAYWDTYSAIESMKRSADLEEIK